MDIIRLDDSLRDLTVDSTIISVDSTVITVDQTQIETGNVTLTLVPRIFPNEGDTLALKLRCEMTDVIIEPTFEWGYVNNYFTLFIMTNDLVAETKYEMDLTRNGVSIAAKGKVLVTNKDKEEIQNNTITAPSVNGKMKF